MLPVYASIFHQIDNHLLNFVTEKCQDIMQLISPAVVALGSLLLMAQGYNFIMGKAEQPVHEFMKTIIKIVGVFGIALSVGNYNSVVVDFFQNSPVVLAAAISDGRITTLNGIGSVLDGILANVVDVGLSFFNVSSFGLSAIAYGIVGVLVFMVGGFATVLLAAYILMAKIVTAITLALGPVFISFYLFDATKNFLAQFVNTLVQYALLIVLSVGANSLVMSMFAHTAAELAKLGATAQIVDLTGLFVTGAIASYVLLQVPNWASSLAGGVALSTSGMNQKILGTGWNLASNKQSRDIDNQAKRNLAINKRMRELEAKGARKGEGGSVSRATKTVPRPEIQVPRSGTFDDKE